MRIAKQTHHPAVNRGSVLERINTVGCVMQVTVEVHQLIVHTRHGGVHRGRCQQGWDTRCRGVGEASCKCRRLSCCHLGNRGDGGCGIAAHAVGLRVQRHQAQDTLSQFWVATGDLADGLTAVLIPILGLLIERVRMREQVGHALHQTGSICLCI